VYWVRKKVGYGSQSVPISLKLFCTKNIREENMAAGITFATFFKFQPSDQATTYKRFFEPLAVFNCRVQ
jgi:hypothetical protein